MNALEIIVLDNEHRQNKAVLNLDNLDGLVFNGVEAFCEIFVDSMTLRSTVRQGKLVEQAMYAAQSED